MTYAGLVEKIVVVTGAAAGSGLGYRKTFAAEGSTFVLVDGAREADAGRRRRQVSGR